jgi:uncharacterized Zn-binding protein involved in type VI secretion
VRFKLQAGREVDVLTKDELQAGLTANTASWFQEMARGLSTARFDGTGTVATAAVLIPPAGQRPIGPDVGFCWALQRVSADGLAAADTLVVYRNSVTPSNRLGVITAAANFHPGSKGVILRGDERLIVTGAALAATGDVTISGEALETSEADLYKLI